MSANIKKVDELLGNFYKLFFKSEDMALKRGIKCLTHTELKVCIEAIGERSFTMNELSDKIFSGILTMGTATVCCFSNLQKGFIARVRSNSDRRKVFVFTYSYKEASALTYHNNYSIK